MENYILKGCQIFSGHSFQKVNIVVADGVVKAVLPWEESFSYLQELYNIAAIKEGANCLVTKGLADTHFHGAKGADFSDGTEEGLAVIEKAMQEMGSRFLCPATMTLPKAQILRAAKTLVNYRKKKRDTKYVGFYLEGPFFHEKKVGAQNPAYLRLPDAGFLEDVLLASEGLCKVVALAPELPGAMELIKNYCSQVTFSIGHTTAEGECARRAFDMGAQRITHLYNGMLHYEDILQAAGEAGNIDAELICDGIHNDRERVLKAFEVLGPEHVIFISDSMRATGMPDGTYDLGGQEICVKGKLAVTEKGAKAGSVSSLADCVRVAISMGVPEKDAWRAAIVNPVRSMGIATEVLEIHPGDSAEFVVFS